MQFSILDVFAERPLEGNQLAVVRGAQDLGTEQMQALAREMNFSETTFVTAESADSAVVRIFTPSVELPFAGHPTLGTAWLLAHGRGRYMLDLPIGRVPVEFIGDVGWLTPPTVRLGPELSAVDAARLIRLAPTQLDPEYPSRFAEVGPQFVLIAVKDRSALRESRVDEDVLWEVFGQRAGLPAVYVFTADAHARDADFASRVYFHAGSMREDPATGSANSAFAAYLRDLRGAGEGVDVVVDQGVEMMRPSRLYLRIGPERSGGEIRVGGKVQAVASGAFECVPGSGLG